MEKVPGRRPRRFSPGCRGHLRHWIPRAARDAHRSTLRAWRSPGAIDSVSGPYGMFITREGVERDYVGRQPPRFRRAGASTGPRRGPPHRLYARCPAGHWTGCGRWSWRAGPAWAPSLVAEWRGRCRRCGAEVSERVDLAMPPEPGRGPSPAELADPGLVATRSGSAAELLAAPGLHPALAEQLRRDYIERDPAAPPWRPPSPRRIRFEELEAAIAQRRSR